MNERITTFIIDDWPYAVNEQHALFHQACLNTHNTPVNPTKFLKWSSTNKDLAIKRAERKGHSPNLKHTRWRTLHEEFIRLQVVQRLKG